MDKPWKVIAAFIGVFIAGAVFGGFFALGFGAHLSASPASATTVTTAPASEPVTAPAAATTSVPAEQKAAAAPTVTASTAPAATPAPKAQPPRPPLLQVPFTWQEPQLMRRYADRLDLTAEQKNKINPVIQRALEDYRRLQQNQFRETSIIVQRMQADIRKELTPDQITELDKMEQRQREIMEKAEARQKAEQQKKVDQQKKKTPGPQKAPGEKKQPKPAPTQPAPTATSSTASSESSSSAPTLSTSTSSATSAPSGTSSTESTSAVVTPTK
jgi:hypothetical protein